MYPSIYKVDTLNIDSRYPKSKSMYNFAVSTFMIFSIILIIKPKILS